MSPLYPVKCRLSSDTAATTSTLAYEEIVTALATADASEAIGEDAAVQVTVDGLLGPRSQRPVGGGEALVVHLNEALEVLRQDAFSSNK